MLRPHGNLNAKLSVRKPPVEICQYQADNPANILLGERLKENRLVQPVEKLRSKMCPKLSHHQLLCRFLNAAIAVNPLQQILCTNVRGHNQNRVLKVHCPAL